MNAIQRGLMDAVLHLRGMVRTGDLTIDEAVRILSICVGCEKVIADELLR